ncbi:MAG: glycosyl hydrolase 108 family protein [Bacteroidota bacterium]
MANFDKAITIILAHEGGFVDNKFDQGGATNKGITFKLFKEYAVSLGLPKTVEALKTLTSDQAKFIYREQFWNKMRGDEIKDQQLANIVFDGFVNMGNRAIKMLQIEMGNPADGIIGDRSLMVINQANPKILFEDYKDARIKFYNDLVARKPDQKIFLKGWLNRINSFVYV